MMHTTRNAAFTLFVFSVGMLFSELLFAAAPGDVGGEVDYVSGTLGEIAINIRENLQGVFDLINGIAILAGAIFGIRSLTLLKDHTDNPGQVRLSRPLTAFITATLLLALPSTITMFADTAFNENSSNQGTMHVFKDLDNVSGPNNANDLSEMAVAFGSSIPALKLVVTVAATLLGAGLILRSLFLLPQLEQGRAEPSKVLWTLIAGVLLWSILPMINVALGTLGENSPDSSSAAAAASSNILAYGYIQNNGANDKFFNTMKAVLMFIQFIGLIAFVRGGLLLKAIGEHKDGAMGRALTHIFGGAAAINITWAVSILAATIGASWICSPTNEAGQTNPLSVMCKND